MACTLTELTLTQGETYVQTIEYTASDGVTPIDLTNYTALMQIRPKINSPTLISELSTTNGKISINGPLGTITLTLTATETQAFTFDMASYTLNITDNAGVATRILEGNYINCKSVIK